MKLLYYGILPERQPLPSESEPIHLDNKNTNPLMQTLISFVKFSAYYGRYLARNS